MTIKQDRLIIKMRKAKEKPMKQKMKGYEYPLKDKEGPYKGYYSIKADAKPLGFKGEKKVSEFTIEIKG